jgi:hypothetical protein
MRHLTVTDSDMIEAIGFDTSENPNDHSSGALEVVFKSSPGDVYRYGGVPAGVFISLLNAESIGKRFHEHFRKTKHPFTKSARSTTLRKSER